MSCNLLPQPPRPLPAHGPPVKFSLPPFFSDSFIPSFLLVFLFFCLLRLLFPSFCKLFHLVSLGHVHLMTTARALGY